MRTANRSLNGDNADALSCNARACAGDFLDTDFFALL